MLLSRIASHSPAIGDALTSLRDQLGRPGVRFCAMFALWLGTTGVLFETWRRVWVDLFMYPVTYGAVLVLRSIGLQADLSGLDATTGVCHLVLESVVYRVTFECTGIFALFLCLASVLAYPTRVIHRIKGLGLVIPAFVCYSVFRLVTLGIVAHAVPQYIELFHLYVMVLVNIGFVLTIWMYWVRTAGAERRLR